MYSGNRQHKRRPYTLKKSGLKEKFVDRQILAIHRAIVAKVILHPELAQQAMATVSERYEQGRIGYGAYLTWQCLLELVGEPEAFRQGVLEDSPKMNKLRRHTPFVGILTEAERQDAIEQMACGETSIESIL